MKTKLLTLVFVVCCLLSFAQDDEPKDETKGFQKEKLFTGGSVSLSFFNRQFLIGVNPVLGYSLTKWADAGIVVNYTYSSQRDYPSFDDRFRQTLYGGGVFTRLFPVRFLFAQAQVEHNFIRQKILYSNSGTNSSAVARESANSVLVGAGYTTGRYPGSGSGFFYMAVLFDVGNDTYSPYKDQYGRTIPIIRAGLHVPLFGRKRDDY